MDRTEYKKKLIKYRDQFLSVYLYCLSDSESKLVAHYAYCAVIKLLKYSIYDIELLKYLEVTFDSLLSQHADIASKKFECSAEKRRMYEYIEYRYDKDKDDADYKAYKLYLHANHLKDILLKKNKTSNAIQYYYAFASLCMCLSIITRSSLRDILKHSPVLTRRLNELKDGIEFASKAVKEIEEEEFTEDTETAYIRELERYREQFLSVYLYYYGRDDSIMDSMKYAYAVAYKLLEYSVYDIELLEFIERDFDSLLSVHSECLLNADLAVKASHCDAATRTGIAFVYPSYFTRSIANREAYNLFRRANRLYSTFLEKHKIPKAVQDYSDIASLCMCLARVTRYDLRDILKHSPTLTSRLNEIKNNIEIPSTEVKKIEDVVKAIAEKRKNERKNTIANSDLSTTTEDSTSTLPASDTSTTQKSKTKTTKSKASPLRNASSGKLDDLHPAVKIFKRFVALNGKEYNRAKVERILKALQREIINHTITKDYEYASEVNNLQTKLVDTLNLETALGKQTGKIEIETDLLARLQHIIGEAKPADAIALLKSYVRLAGSTNKDKAKRLLKRFDRYNIETPSSALTPHLKSAKNALLDFVEGKSTAIALDEFALHGLDYINYR